VKSEDDILPPAKASRGEKRKQAITPDSETGIESMEIVDDEEVVFLEI